MTKHAGTWMALLLSVCIALAMGFLFAGSADSSGALAGKPNAETLSDNNLVDLLQALPLHLAIRKADISQSVLSVDLIMPSSGWNQERVYRDLYTLSEFGFTKTANVKQVLVRVLEGDRSNRTVSAPLLAAMDARKSSRSALDKKKEMTEDALLSSYLKSHYIMTYTQRWEARTTL